MQETSMNSRESMPEKQNKMPAIIQANQQVVQTWKQNFAGDMVISNTQITIDAGLKETRLTALKKTVERVELIGIIVLQITDLLDFLGMQSKMSAKQIFDTAEFIIDDYDNFSFTGVQHCFNMIKKSEAPFNDTLYNSITGRKIIDWLHKYDTFVDDYLFQEAESKIYHDQFRAYDRKKNVGDGLIGMSGALTELKNNVKKHKNAK